MQQEKVYSSLVSAYKCHPGMKLANITNTARRERRDRFGRILGFIPR
jgi:hypothetical protein